MNTEKYKRYQLGNKIVYDRKSYADAINNQNRARAKGYLSGVPSIQNIAKGLYYAYKGWIDPVSPYNTGVAPVVGGFNTKQVVGLMEKQAPTLFKFIAESPNEVRRLSQSPYGYWDKANLTYRPMAEKLKKFFKTGDEEVLGELENWAKNATAPKPQFNDAATQPKGFLNYSSPNKNIDYMFRGTKPKPMSDDQWVAPKGEGLGSYLDRIITIK